jgi:ATP/ADP translocase
MKDRLLQLLGIEHGEESMVSMLLTQSIFLGIFYGAFDISAHSLFLAIFDEKVMAKAYVVSGFTGIILTGLYTWLQTNLRFKNFAIINLIFVTLLTLCLWAALLFNPSKLIIFIVFVMLGPLNILAMLGFWGTTGRLFTLRQGKRLFGLIDAGLIIGIILSCYAIPVLLTFNFKSHNILLISTGGILVAAFFQILIGNRFNFAAGRTEKPGEKKTGLSVFRDDSYIRMMGIFVALSVMTAFFIQYSFMAVTREQYPAEEDMARFLGLFTGSMMIFTLLIKVLVFSYLIRNYGLKICLAISPVLVVGFTAIAIIIGISMGYTPASTGGFIIFFLVLALSRLFSKSLKDSIESPSFKVIYQTVDEKIRYEVQSGIDGTINEIAALASGLLLAGLGLLTFIKLIHFSLVLFVIIIAWIFVALRLYFEYRKSIRKSLETAGTVEADLLSAKDYTSLKGRYSGINLFKSNYFKLISDDLSVIDKNTNRWLLEQIISHSGTKQDINMLPALKKIAGNADIDETIRQKSAEVIDQFEETNGDPRKLKSPVSLQTDDEKIINARKTLSSPRQPQTTEILRLLRDNHIDSKRYAIYMIGKFRLNDMLPEVCDCLNIPGLEADATSVLRSFGNDASDELRRFYLSSSGNINISKIILRLLAGSFTNENSAFMFARLWSNSRQLKEVAAKCLIDNGYRATDEEKDKLHQLISEIIGMMTWNISAQSCLVKNDDTSLLEVIKKESVLWNTFLFNILSIAYDPGSLSKIRSNLESGTLESVNYALEMIDIVIDDSIKSKLVSLIDVVSDDEKLKNLHQFYPGEVPPYSQLIEDIINRDYNLISIWAKASALRNMNEITGKNSEESVIALLFSPEQILQEETARLISRTNKGFFRAVSDRIPKESKRLLEKIVSGDVTDNEFLFEKVKFLSALFKEIPEDELLYLAGKMKYSKDLSFTGITENRCIILWNLLPDKSDIRVFTVFDSDTSGLSSKFIVSGDAFFYLLPLDVLEDFQNLYPGKSFEVFSYLDKHEYSI